MLGELVEGLDVTDFLDITQYIPQIPANISGEVKGVFPNFIPRQMKQEFNFCKMF